MFGPVMTAIRFFPLSRYVSFATNRLSLIIFSTTGWRPFLMLISPFSLIFGFT